MKEEKMKLQVTMSKNLIERMDKVCAQYGVSRSQYCAMVLGQNVATAEKINSSIDEKMISNIVGGLINEK